MGDEGTAQKEVVNAEREARVEIAKADSQKQGVTVNTSKS